MVCDVDGDELLVLPPPVPQVTVRAAAVFPDLDEVVVGVTDPIDASVFSAVEASMAAVADLLQQIRLHPSEHGGHR
ncbi:MAG: hypothetical protein QM809_11365 [Gordonia sp. (in: high G+C Gram-positive bacteria)]|uniref:hypothetical protein n=1 Tax=Gordonia sp. (in: high G+C Gram-positive bacteria) TaxID=84139 RepID=UPI0039E5032E